MALPGDINTRAHSSYREVNTGTASLGITLDSAIAGEDLTNDVLKVEERFSYSNSVFGTGGGLGTIKSGAGFVHNVTLGNFAASGVISVYDSIGTSATKITTVTLPATLLQQPPVTIPLNVTFSTGLTVGCGTTADITVSYR